MSLLLLFAGAIVGQAPPDFESNPGYVAAIPRERFEADVPAENQVAVVRGRRTIVVERS